LTAVGVIAGGFSLEEIWLILFGVYTLIASVILHRIYTHSIQGFIFFGFIAKNLEVSLGIQGVYYTCLAGYIHYLITDKYDAPFLKGRIKLFLPVTSRSYNLIVYEIV